MTKPYARPTRFDAYALLHRGAQALARAEWEGLYIDLNHLKSRTTHLLTQLETARKKVMASELGKQWERLYPGEVKLRSPIQSKNVLFGHFKLPVISETEKGNPQINEEALLSYQKKVPGVEHLLRVRALDKTLFTYFAQIQRETLDGRMHPFFHLHTVQTYRGSSSDPNFQNMPNRDAEFAEVVRRAILPPPGFQIGEIDYKSLEVCFAAVVTRDPNLITYVSDPTTDMHRDTGVELFLLEELTKKIRHVAKNGFVFPEFYGSYWEQCAKNIWADIASLTTPAGEDLRAHLKNKGLSPTRPSSNGKRSRPAPSPWEQHVRDVEDSFWGERFPVYAQWRKDQYESYLDKGYVETNTGFRCGGLMNKNQVGNYPIQGPSFHALLWSLTETDREIRKQKLRSRICGQIHDSMVTFLHPEERVHVLSMIKDISTRRLREAWPWVDVPLTVEIDVSPVDKSWFEKTAWDGK